MHIENNSKLYTRSRFPREKSSGLVIGRMTRSCNVFFTYSWAPTSSNLTPISSGRTTAESKARSYSPLAKLCTKLFIQHEKKIMWIECFHIILKGNDKTSRLSECFLDFCSSVSFVSFASSSINLEIASLRLHMTIESIDYFVVVKSFINSQVIKTGNLPLTRDMQLFPLDTRKEAGREVMIGRPTNNLLRFWINIHNEIKYIHKNDQEKD